MNVFVPLVCVNVIPDRVKFKPKLSTSSFSDSILFIVDLSSVKEGGKK